MEALLLWIVCGIAGGMIYQSKNRPFIKGFLWGFLFKYNRAYSNNYKKTIIKLRYVYRL